MNGCSDNAPITTAALRSPEVLLSNLNRVALELRGAIAVQGNPTLNEQLTAVTRLFIADLLSRHWITPSAAPKAPARRRWCA